MRLFVPIFGLILAFFWTSPRVQAQPLPDAAATETHYWNVQIFLRPTFSNTERRVRSYLPRSREHQNVVSFRQYAPDFDYREQFTQDNLEGIWTSKPEKTTPSWIITDFNFVTKAQKKPKTLKVSTDIPESVKTTIRKNEPSLQSQLKEKMGQLDVAAKPLAEKVRILFDYVLNSIAYEPDNKLSTIHEVLAQSKANTLGKTRLFLALMSELGLPVRQVNGLVLEDRSIKKGTHIWAQVYLNNQWLSFDLIKGHFANLPENHLEIFYGDDHASDATNGVDYDHQFVIMRTSEDTVMDIDDLIIPQDDLVHDDYFKKMVSKENYVKKAFGRIAIVTDYAISDAVIEKISKQAALNEVKVNFYSAAFESHFFRGNYIARILSQKYHNIRKADAIFILSEDDAGLYALFQMAQNKMKLTNTSVFLSGAFSHPVANILGHTLFKLLKPKELFISPKKLEIERAWDVLKDNILDGLPIQDVAKRWNVPINNLSEQKDENLSAWRRFIINTLVLASKSDVNLQSIYLILILPLIALVVVIYRNVIGLETFGVFSPILIAVSFLTTGLLWGVIMFTIIVITGVIVRAIFINIHLHIVARMAMLIALVGITMLTSVIVGVYLGWGSLVNISILPMVIMAGIVENFTQTQMEVGFPEAFRLTIYTLIVAVISYLIIDTVGFQSLVLVFPEIIIVAILLEILIGRWSGVRLMEYVRFYKITGPK